MQSKYTGLIKVGVLITFAVMVIINALANSLPINGITTGKVSDSYPDLFAPAGITFAIWGLIYLLLAGYTLYQLGLFQDDKGTSRAKLFERVGVPFIISSVANSLWIFAWHYDFIGLSLLLMLVILACLMAIALQLAKEEFSGKESFFIRMPFSVYFGWITVATIANVTTFLVSVNWDGWGIAEAIWTAAVLVVGLIIGSVTMIRFQDIAYGLVIIWAYAGILIKHTADAEFAGAYPTVITTAIICIVFLFLAGVYQLFKVNQKKAYLS